jgi:hypothetical protein
MLERQKVGIAVAKEAGNTQAEPPQQKQRHPRYCRYMPRV